MTGPTIGSLFTGYGGLDLAVEAYTGGRTAWVSDIDPGACQILAHRYPDTPNLGDISAVDWTEVEPVDVLTGGFPCQDVSAAGRRAGLRPGTRSGLWQQMAYAINQLRPRYVVAENVRGLLSAPAHSDVESCPWCVGDGSDGAMRALGAVLADLADLGYDAQWCGLRAADVGAPHGRFRVFILATDTRGEAREQRTRLRAGEPAGIRRGRPRNRDGASTLLPTPTARDHKGHNQRRDTSCLTGALLPTPTATPYGNNQSPSPGAAVRPSLDSLARLLPTPRATDGTKGGPNQRGSSGDLMLPSAVNQLLPTPTAADARASGGGYNGQSNVTLTDATSRHPERFGQYADAVARWAPIVGRAAPDPTTNGRLSAQFVEWMMGLPAGWVTDTPGLRRAQQLKALGNGVVPQQAYAALSVLEQIAGVAA